MLLINVYMFNVFNQNSYIFLFNIDTKSYSLLSFWLTIGTYRLSKKLAQVQGNFERKFWKQERQQQLLHYQTDTDKLSWSIREKSAQLCWQISARDRDRQTDLKTWGAPSPQVLLAQTSSLVLGAFLVCIYNPPHILFVVHHTNGHKVESRLHYNCSHSWRKHFGCGGLSWKTTLFLSTLPVCWTGKPNITVSFCPLSILSNPRCNISLLVSTHPAVREAVLMGNRADPSHLTVIMRKYKWGIEGVHERKKTKGWEG